MKLDLRVIELLESLVIASLNCPEVVEHELRGDRLRMLARPPATDRDCDAPPNSSALWRTLILAVGNGILLSDSSLSAAHFIELCGRRRIPPRATAPRAARLSISQTAVVKVGLLHPGEMGVGVGAALQTAGQAVLWASAGRSAATAKRAKQAGLEDVGRVDELASRCDLVLSLVPPHAAVEMASSLAGFPGVYVDANAVSPSTARAIGGLVGRYVDGGIIGPPPREPGTTRLYLSGTEAGLVADLFADTVLEAIVVSEDPSAASAVKMAYAAWTKGTSALLLAIRALARIEQVEQALLHEWEISRPDVAGQSEAAARSGATKGWRWVGEMNEIAETFADSGLPNGFHRAAAEIYERSSHTHADSDSHLEDVLSALRTVPGTRVERA